MLLEHALTGIARLAPTAPATADIRIGFPPSPVLPPTAPPEEQVWLVQQPVPVTVMVSWVGVPNPGPPNVTMPNPGPPAAPR